MGGGPLVGVIRRKAGLEEPGKEAPGGLFESNGTYLTDTVCSRGTL